MTRISETSISVNRIGATLNRRWALRLLQLALLCNLAVLAWYIGVGYRHMLHADSAVMSLLAQEIVETGTLFPPDWTYANNDLWVAFTHTLVLPALALLPNGYGAHAVARCMVALLVLHATWRLAGVAGQSPAARIVSLLMLSAGWSVTMAENLYGQAAYGILYAMSAYLIAFTVAAMRAPTGPRSLAAAGAALVLLLACWMNPPRAAVFYAAPLLLAGLVVLMRGNAPRSRSLQVALLLALGSAAGVALHWLTSRGVNLPKGISQVQYIGIRDMPDSAGRALEGLLLLFDAVPSTGADVVSHLGVIAGARLVLGVGLVLVALPWAIRRAWQLDRHDLTACVAFSAAGLAITLFFLIATSLPSNTAMEGSIRYVVPALTCLLVLFAGIAIDHGGRARPVTLLALAAIVMLCASAGSAYVVPGARPFAARSLAPAERMADFLRQNGLRYGYATFWQSGHLTVLADGAVRVRPIAIEHGLPMPVQHLSSDRWYRPDYYHGETFLLLRDDELAQLNLPALSTRVGAPARTLRFEGNHVLVYARNLAELPEWDRSLRNPAVYPVTTQTPHQVGTLEGDSLVAAPGTAGALRYGPFRALARGDYVVTFDIEATGPAAAGFGTVDVAAGGAILVQQSLTAPGRRQITLRLRAPKRLDGVEFRVFSNGQGRVVARDVRIMQAPAAPAMAGTSG